MPNFGSSERCCALIWSARARISDRARARRRFACLQNSSSHSHSHSSSSSSSRSSSSRSSSSRSSSSRSSSSRQGKESSFAAAAKDSQGCVHLQKVSVCDSFGVAEEEEEEEEGKHRCGQSRNRGFRSGSPDQESGFVGKKVGLWSVEKNLILHCLGECLHSPPSLPLACNIFSLAILVKNLSKVSFSSPPSLLRSCRWEPKENNPLWYMKEPNWGLFTFFDISQFPFFLNSASQINALLQLAELRKNVSLFTMGIEAGSNLLYFHYSKISRFPLRSEGEQNLQIFFPSFLVSVET